MIFLTKSEKQKDLDIKIDNSSAEESDKKNLHSFPKIPIDSETKMSQKELIQKERIKSMFDFLAIHESDAEYVAKKKESLTKIVKKLQDMGKLSGEILKDYLVLGKPIMTEKATIYKVIDFAPKSSNSVKTLRSIPFLFGNKGDVCQELEILLRMEAENLVSLEKVFFEHPYTQELSVNIVMPWMSAFKTWLMESADYSLHDLSLHFSISKCKRSLAEIRNLFRSILSTLKIIHSHGIVLINLNFDSIFIADEDSNALKRKTQTRSQKFKAVLLCDFSCAVDLNLSGTYMCTRGFFFFKFSFNLSISLYFCVR